MWIYLKGPGTNICNAGHPFVSTLQQQDASLDTSWSILTTEWDRDLFCMSKPLLQALPWFMWGQQFFFFFFKWANAELSAQLILLRMVSACWTVHFSRQTLSTKKISSPKPELLENCNDAALSESCTAECRLIQTAAQFVYSTVRDQTGRIWEVRETTRKNMACMSDFNFLCLSVMMSRRLYTRMPQKWSQSLSKDRYGHLLCYYWLVQKENKTFLCTVLNPDA